MKYIVIVPTKSRYNFEVTKNWISVIIKSLPLEKYQFIIEKEEIELYKNNCGIREEMIDCLPVSNMGIGYVRNYILRKYILSGSYDGVFLIDDDMKGFCFFDEEGKQRTFDWNNNNIEEVLKQFFDSPYTLTGMCYKQNQYFMTKCNDGDCSFFREFGRPTTFVYYNIKNFKNIDLFKKEYSKYDINKYRVYEDVYIACAMLLSGNMIGMNFKYSLSVPVMSTSMGGCFDDYQKGQSLICAKEINKIIGNGFSSIIENHGRVEIKIDWKELYQSYVLKNNTIKGFF
jgi:hypothetical protein